MKQHKKDTGYGESRAADQFCLLLSGLDQFFCKVYCMIYNKVEEDDNVCFYFMNSYPCSSRKIG